jgi:hypothetical protein
MPQFKVITPLDRGDDELVAPGETVELPAKEGNALAAIGALEKVKAPAKEKAAEKPAPATPAA